MYRLAYVLLIAVGLVGLSGCSKGTAATVQHPPEQHKTPVAFAPQNDVVADAPVVRIPEGRKATPAPAKPSAPPTDDSVASAPDDNSDTIQATSYQQERRQQGQEKGYGRRNGNGNGNGMRTEGKQNSRQDDKQRTDKTQDAGKQFASRKEQLSPKSAEASDKSKDTSAVVASNEPKPTQAPVSSDSSSSGSTPANPSTFGSSSGSSAPSGNSSAQTGSSTFPVTYGSSTFNSSRSYKKPTIPDNAPSWFKENDKDGDGQLTMNEWPPDRFEEFSKYDRNGDGIITLEEAMKTVPKVVAAPPATTTTPPAAGAAAPAASTPTSTTPAPAAVTTSGAASSGGAQSMRMTFGGGAPAAPGTPLTDEEAKRQVEQTFNFLDANKDGFLDDKEIENSRRIKSIDWKKYDVNKDGKLDKTEATALFKAEGSNMRGGGPGGGGPWAGRSPDEIAKVMFDNMDRAKTGKISKENFPGYLRDRFAEFDTNKDGFVDFEEFKANRDKMMPNRGGNRGFGGEGGGGNRGFGGANGGDGGRGNRGQGGFNRQ